MTDDDVLLAQLQSNGIRPETKPVEFSERLAQLMQRYPDMTVPKMARMIRKSPGWIRRVLRLGRLDLATLEAVRRGEIALESACALAQLPTPLQEVYAKQAKTMPVKKFVSMVRAEVKRYKEAAMKGFLDKCPPKCWEPVPYLRTLKEIKGEYHQPKSAGAVLLQTKAETPFDGWKACLAWLLHMDPESLEEQEQMIARRHDQQRCAEERRKRERQMLRRIRERSGDNNIITLELEDLEHE
jgi:ParB-like chromosome segregation protein Spo0J